MTLFNVALQLIGLYILYLFAKYAFYKFKMWDMPDAGFTWYFGNLKTLFATTDARKQPIFMSWIGATPIVQVCDPVIAKEMLRRGDDFEKHIPMKEYSPTYRLIYNDMHLSNGEDWKRKHDIIAPAFHFDKMAIYSKVFVQQTQRLISFLDKVADAKAEVDMNDWFRRFTVDVLGEACFSYGFNSLEFPDSELFHAYEDCLAQIIDPVRQVIPIIDLFPSIIPYAGRYKKNADRMQTLFSTIILSKRQETAEARAKRSPDLMDFLLGAVEEKDDFTHDDLLRNMMLFYIAGHDTTQGALTWAFHHLGTKPELQKRLQAEVDEVLGERQPTYDDTKKMVFLSAFMKEVLRYNNIVSQVPIRRCARDTTLGGKPVAAGAVVNLCISSIHRDEQYHKDALEFRPERWLEKPNEKNSEKKHPYSYLPFSMGPRICVGQNFSLVEQRIVMSMLLQRYSVTYIGDAEVPTDVPNPMLNLITSLRCKLTRRVKKD